MLLLRGSTVSQAHESQLHSIVARQFGDDELLVDFRPQGTAPAWWQGATTELLKVLAAVQSPTARLLPDELQITGIVPDQSVVDTSLETLQAALPGSTIVDIRLATIESPTDTRALCERQFAVFESGPVHFEESSTAFKTSSYPALERVLALADACRDSTISITGHTDASGHEDWNRKLSLARAQTVANYLRERGIDGERIVVSGAGSSSPIADNATRFGRSRNRRIDIDLESR